MAANTYSIRSILKTILKVSFEKTSKENITDENPPHFSNLIHDVETSIEEQTMQEHPWEFAKTIAVLMILIGLSYIIYIIIISVYQLFINSIHDKARDALPKPGDLLPTVPADMTQLCRRPKTFLRMNEPVEVCLLQRKPTSNKNTPQKPSRSKTPEPIKQDAKLTSPSKKADRNVQEHSTISKVIEKISNTEESKQMKDVKEFKESVPLVATLSNTSLEQLKTAVHVPLECPERLQAELAPSRIPEAKPNAVPSTSCTSTSSGATTIPKSEFSQDEERNISLLAIADALSKGQRVRSRSGSRVGSRRSSPKGSSTNVSLSGIKNSPRASPRKPTRSVSNSSLKSGGGGVCLVSSQSSASMCPTSCPPSVSPTPTCFSVSLDSLPTSRSTSGLSVVKSTQSDTRIDKTQRSEKDISTDKGGETSGSSALFSPTSASSSKSSSNESTGSSESTTPNEKRFPAGNSPRKSNGSLEFEDGSSGRELHRKGSDESLGSPDPARNPKGKKETRKMESCEAHDEPMTDRKKRKEMARLPAMALMQMYPDCSMQAGCLQCQNQPLFPVSFRWHDLSATSVFLTGSFLNWESKIPLKKDRYGWGVVLSLPKGHFEYKFIVDRDWAVDETRQPTIMSRQGQLNHVVHV